MQRINTQQQILIQSKVLNKSIHLESIQDYLYCKSNLNKFKLTSCSRIYIETHYNHITLLIKANRQHLQNQLFPDFIHQVRNQISLRDGCKHELWQESIQICEFQKKIFRSQIGILIFRKEYSKFESEQFQKYLFTNNQQFKLENICQTEIENCNENKYRQIFEANDLQGNLIPTGNKWFFINTKYLDLDSSIIQSFKSNCLVPLSSKLLLDLEIYYNLTIKLISQKYLSHLSTPRLREAITKLLYFFTKQFVHILADNDAFKFVKSDFQKLYECLKSSDCYQKLAWFFTNHSIKEFTSLVNEQAYCELGYHCKILFSANFSHKEKMKQVIRLLVYFGLSRCISFKEYPNQRTAEIYNFLSWQNLLCLKQRGQFSSRKMLPKYIKVFKTGDWDQAHTKQSNSMTIFENSLQKMINILKYKDFIYFIRSWEFFQLHLKNAIKNWKLYTQEETQKIEYIFNIINHRYQEFKLNFDQILQTDTNNPKQQSNHTSYFSLYQYFLPNIKQILTELKKYCRIKSDQKEYQIENCFDKLLLNFFTAIKQKYTNVYNLNIRLANKETKQFPQFIYNLLTKQYYMSDWCDIFNIITLNSSNLMKQYLKRAIPEQHSQFIKRLQLQYLPDSQCLSCTQYLIYQTSITTNFKLKSYKLQIFPTASQIRPSSRLIAQAICMMLNSPTGGVILFDCLKCYGGFIPYGQTITQKDKEGYQNRIKEIIALLYPKPTFGGEVIVSFVPVGLHPMKNTNQKREFIKYTEELKNKQLYLSQNFMEGKYVMRIKVASKNDGTAYMWMSEDNKDSGFQYCCYPEDAQKFLGSKHSINIQEQLNNSLSFSTKYLNTKLYKIIKYKLKQSQKIQQDIYKYFRSVPPLSHNCKIPFPGKPITIKDPNQTYQSPKSPINLENQYNHMSIMVFKLGLIYELQKNLRESGIKFHLQRRFQGLKLAKNAIIIYHDDNFSRLLSIVQNIPILYADNRRAITLYVTKYALIQQMTQKTVFSGQQWKNNNLWIQTYLPGESIKLYQFTSEGRRQYYIEGSTKLATLCMYFILNQYKLKTRFKNPQGIDRMTKQQRDRIFVEKVFGIR